MSVRKNTSSEDSLFPKTVSVVVEEYFGMPMAVIILNALRSIVSG